MKNSWSVSLVIFHLSEARQHNLVLNPLSAKFIKWLNTLKQFVSKLPTNCLSVFDHFVGLALKLLNPSLLVEYNQLPYSLYVNLPHY